MTTEQTYALLALRVYDAQLVNKPLPPPPWTEILPQPTGTDGFAYAVYKNPDTNEVVISYRGTDNDVGDWTSNLGFSISQATQAAAVYARVLLEYGTDAQGSNITFTGHSLGGGLAATMAVWFNRPATVFDPAPTQASAQVSSYLDAVITTLGANAPQSIKDYRAAIYAQFTARESNVTSYAAPGSIVYSGNFDFNTITGAGQFTPVQFGIENMGGLGRIDMHSQALLTAGLLSTTFAQATVSVQRALPLIMDKQLYALPTTGSDRNLLIDLIRSEQTNAGNGKLTHFAADLNKLGTNIAGLNKAAQDTLIAQGIEWYYWQGTDYAGQEFFTQTGTLLQYTTAKGADLQGAQDKASQYAGTWLAALDSEYGLAYMPIIKTDYQQWNVNAGSDASTATAKDTLKTQIFIGQAGVDTFTGGDKDDVFFGGAGDDILDGGNGDDNMRGGTGDDTLTGGDGADALTGGAGTDTYNAGAGDTITDSDGAGSVVFDGSTLNGGSRKKGETVYHSQDGNYAYTLNGSILTVNGTLTIKDFINKDLGIYLDEKEDPADPPKPPTYNPNNSRFFSSSPLALDINGNGRIAVNDGRYVCIA